MTLKSLYVYVLCLGSAECPFFSKGFQFLLQVSNTQTLVCFFLDFQFFCTSVRHFAIFLGQTLGFFLQVSDQKILQSV